MTTSLRMTINGRDREASAEDRTQLSDFIRDCHGMTGTHLGCEHGICGACTVLIDGEPARSCITLAAAVEGASITTIEGLDDDEIAAELRAAFTREHGLQCGYCTPGMIVSARDVVLRLPEADDAAIRVAMSGNLCRCTGYVGIIRAIASVIEDRRGRGIPAVPSGHRDSVGPVGAGRPATPRVDAPVADRQAPRPQAAPAVNLDADWDPQGTFVKSFTLSRPADEVWEIFGQPADVVDCVPGATLTGTDETGDLQGRIRIKVGPIAANFAGLARMERDDATMTGRIVGGGRDGRSGSATRARATYRVLPDASGTGSEVTVTVDYALTGALAQFGRPGLIADIAGRIIDAFATNLEHRLAGGDVAGTPAPTGDLNAGSLVGAIIGGRIRTWMSRLGLGKGDRG